MTSTTKIRSTAITRAGYEYQDLVGIEVLIRAFRDPDLFEWIQIESSDPDYKSLDDVVAKRKDGSVEFYQVKFTVDPHEYQIDWKWLLSSKPKGTSLLHKWSSGFQRAKANGTLHTAKLMTNRGPSPEFAKLLVNSRVDLTQVDAATLQLVETECGGKTNAAEFFAEFSFGHSLADLEHFEAEMRDKIVPTDTDIAGWHLLRASVRRWAIIQKEPAPHGLITRDHIVSLITKKRPKPLNQDFTVPEGYAPPNDEFHAAVVNRVADGAHPVTVVWGTPGRGKSTYLSHLTSTLEVGQHAVIRHHYFVSLLESSADRSSFSEIAASLQSQLVSNYPADSAGVGNDAAELRTDLELVARNLKPHGKKLVIVVDGLDHVYRDTRRVDQLNYLFNVIFPLPENVVLLVGTQKVPDEQLPAKLVSATKPADWLEIPKMDEAAVQNWVLRQHSSRPLPLRQPAVNAHELADIAKAFADISQGHPLYLIFAYEALLRRGGPLTAADVRGMPGCPGDDIRSYYAQLWLTLTSSAKDVLHVLAGSEFYWPPLGIRQCVGDYHEIAFLLEPSHQGLLPFHGSVFAWVREQSDHKETMELMRPRVLSWLETDAPEFWRWGWLWLVKAASGDRIPLVSGATRDWARSSFAEGYPEQHIEIIVRDAARHALKLNDLPATVRLCLLYDRVSNARTYQARDFGTYKGAALRIHHNNQATLSCLENLTGLTDDEIYCLARLSTPALFQEVSNTCADELRRRIQAHLILRNQSTYDFDSLTRNFLQTLALSGSNRVDEALRFIGKLAEPLSGANTYINTLADRRDSEALGEVYDRLSSDESWSAHCRDIQHALLRSTLHNGTTPADYLNIDASHHPILVSAWLAKQGIQSKGQPYLHPVTLGLPRERRPEHGTGDLEIFLHEVFWSEVERRIRIPYDFSSVHPPLDRGELGLLDVIIDSLEELAHDLVSGVTDWTFAAAFTAAASVPSLLELSPNDTRRSQYQAFLKALNSIALNIHLFGLTAGSDTRISASELNDARGSVHWVDELWLDRNADTMVPLFANDAAAAWVSAMSDELAAKFTETNERAEHWAKLAVVAIAYELTDASRLIARATSSLLGYAHRKDPNVFDTIDAISTVNEVDTSLTWQRIAKIAPLVETITLYTDGDETRHAKPELIEMIARVAPSKLIDLHRHHTANDNWYLANICLSEAMKMMDFASPFSAALSSTLVDEQSLAPLKERAEHDPLARTQLDEQTAFLGGLAGPEAKPRPAPERGQDITPPRDAKSIGADEFALLVEELRDPRVQTSTKSEYFDEWIAHWRGAGKARQTMKSIREYYESEDTYWADEFLDRIFEISLQVEGKDKAYTWIVRAQQLRRGWISYHSSSSEATARFDRFAAIYPDRWLEFIKESSEQTGYLAEFGLMIGKKRLVSFLIKVGQTELAGAIADELVEGFIQDTSDQPVQSLAWL